MFELASIADTVWLPFGRFGIVISTPEKEPSSSVVTLAGSVVTVTPSTLMVMALLAAKPEPATVTRAPSGPVMGSIVIEGVIVKAAVAVFVPSLAVILLDPFGDTSTVTVVDGGMLPLPSAVQVVVEPSTLVIVTVELGI